MKTASMVLGIIGGAIALLIALLIICGGIATFNQGIWDQNAWDYGSRGAAEFGRNVGGTFVIIFGGFAAIGGILGLVGGLTVKRSNVAAGVMMIIAAVISLIPSFISMILFVLGAVFAFVREKPACPPFPPYPPQPPAPPQA